jgi:uncharacterized protein YkwD
MRGSWRRWMCACVLWLGCGSDAMPMPEGTQLGGDNPLGSTRAADEDAGVPEFAKRDDVPDTDHCAPVAYWNPKWAEFEDQVLVLTNEARAQQQDCGVEGVWNATTSLVMEPRLRCAARLHSQYMAAAENDFAHETRTGSVPGQRVNDAGYDFSMVGENIAVGSETPEDVVKAWLASDGHCKVLMQPGFTQIGIGYAFGTWDTMQPAGIVQAPYWTQDYGLPAAD